MILKMQEITVYNKDGDVLNYLTQWDKNVVIQLKDANLSKATYVHFFNCNSKEGMIMAATYKDGILSTQVPNDILTEPHTITGYVWVDEDPDDINYESDEHKSVYCFRIMVRKHPKPLNQIYEDQKEFITFDKILSDAKGYSLLTQSYAIGNTNLRENEDTDNAEFYYNQSKNKAEAASTSASNAATSASNAANSAASATNKANAAATSASNAATSATNAETYAKQSQSYALGTGGVRANEATDNAKHYYEKAKEIYDDFNSAGNVSGVKGGAETAYRTGLVNLTPENIGALPGVKQLTTEDLNNVKEPCLYYAIGGNSVAHKPSGVAHFGLEVLKSAGSWTTQILYGSNKNTYIRWKDDSSWSAWKRVLNEDDKLPQNIGNNGTGGISVGTGLVLNDNQEKTVEKTFSFKSEISTYFAIEEIDIPVELPPGATQTVYGIPIYLSDNSIISYLVNYMDCILEEQGKIVSYSDPEVDRYGYYGLYVVNPNELLLLYEEREQAEHVIDEIYYDTITITISVQQKSTPFYQTILGQYNWAVGSYNKNSVPVFSIGGGTRTNSRRNLLRLNSDSKMYLGAGGAYISSGADHAEFIKPWLDGNPENEDRVGYMVTYAYTDNGIFIKKANPGDYIAGITSGNPCLVGNADEDYYWKYERDDFNRLIMEEVPETEQQKDEEGNPIFAEESEEPVMIETGRMVKVPKIAGTYDPSKPYKERKDRQEWDYVGMVGVIPVRDDGTCVPGQFCKCGGDGIATLAEERGFDTFFILERISENVVSVEMKGN